MEMASSWRHRIAFAFLVCAALALSSPLIHAEEATVTPSDDDPYLPVGEVISLQIADASRRHLRDTKLILMFGIGFIGGSILVSRI